MKKAPRIRYNRILKCLFVKYDELEKDEQAFLIDFKFHFKRDEIEDNGTSVKRLLKIYHKYFLHIFESKSSKKK